MLKSLCIVTVVTVGGFVLQSHGLAESLETHSNPVDPGTIHVAPDDPERSDWDDIPWYEFDDDFVEFYPVDIDRVQMAHDASYLYIHFQTLEWDVDEAWRVGIYLDTDQDTTTGYTGNFLPVGADYFLEESSAFAFDASTQVDWGWAENGGALRDQSSMLDVELAVPRSAIGNPTALDFILFANNFCCDFQMPDDIYPNAAGAVFTYELGEVSVAPGDCNTDGSVNAGDLECVVTVQQRDHVLIELNSLPGDLDGDGTVAFADFLSLSANFGTDLTRYVDGNIDLTGGVEFADFLILSSNFGKTRTAAVSVPESGTSWWIVGGVILWIRSIARSRRR